MPDGTPLLEIRRLGKEYALPGGGRRRAVQDVSFTIRRGETFGLAGRSSSGKSTIGRMILGLIAPGEGEIRFEGQALPAAAQDRELRLRARLQMVFQDPLSSMNPKRTAGDVLDLPQRNFGLGSAAERRERTLDLLNLVGLSPRHVGYYPHEFSGGQCQRLGIARALASNPDFIFLDEPVSALDVSIQAQILNLLKQLQEKLGLTYLLVANNLNVARFICDRLAILEAGRIVETGRNEEIFASPQHQVTRDLLAAIISLDRRTHGAAASFASEH